MTTNIAAYVTVEYSRTRRPRQSATIIHVAEPGLAPSSADQTEEHRCEQTKAFDREKVSPEHDGT